jgi:predicted hydrolase (HD superfamily)
LERALFACDELCGFLTACALVTPTKSLHDVKVKSVRKKMKSKAFAAAVSREDIVAGAEGLGVELTEHIGFVLDALRGVAVELDLAGPAGEQGASRQNLSH